MNQYNSYYLYQQYEKRGNQDWLPSYPNIFSVDGDGTMPLVMKKENDPDCGYTGDTQPIYRWYPLPITTDYICDECPAVQYRWENISITEDYVCVGTDKYYKQKRQYSYDSGTTWYDVTPPETQTGSLYQTGSTDCGYVPPIEPQYRTTSGTPYCEGYDKYVDIYSQVSYDGGSTWSTTATTPTLVEAYSQDCGYVPPSTGTYLTFEAIDSGKFKLSGNSVSYSLDSGSTWSTLAANTNSPSVSAGSKIMWKGNLTPSASSSPYGVGTFVSTGRFQVEGNPMSLLYGDNFIGQINLTGKDSAFRNLFSGCTGLTSAENLELPAMTLAVYCYRNMFINCTSLASAPTLPATTLTNGCYCFMFSGCTSLTSAPTLPATTLAPDCYEGMFSHTSLTSAPALPATTLASACYYGMFDSTPLTTAPVLPATALTSDCYNDMFKNCTSLTTAPELPATTLADSCYCNMFSGCTSLATAPVLPATTLADSCYMKMFYGCTSLTTSPRLPAYTLTDNCYYHMFYGCSSLNKVTCLAIDRSATSCTTLWLSGVSSSGTFYKAGAAEWGRGSSGIPTNWSIDEL